MAPFFGVDDIIEFSIADIVLSIGAEVIGEITGTVATATASVGELFNSIVGPQAIQSIIDLVKIGGGEVVASNVLSVDEIGGLTLKTIEDEGILLWEAEAPEIAQKVPESIFINKFKELALALVKQGIDLKDTDGIELLKIIGTKALQMGKNGVQKVVNPKVISGAILGTLGTNAIYQKFKRKADNAFKLGTIRKVNDETVEEIERF